MLTNKPQFSPTGGEGSQYGGFTFTEGNWVQDPVIPPKPRKNPGIVSTTDYRDQLASYDVTAADLSNDPYMKLFAQLNEKNAKFEEQGRLNAEAQANRERVQQEQRNNANTAGIESANIAGGLSRYAPELANSSIAQAYNENYQKVQDIQAAEDLAIAKYKEARAANDLNVVKEQLDYVSQLRKAKADAISEANKMAFEREKFEKNYALDVQREGRLSAESKLKTAFDFGQEVADLEQGDPGLMAYIRLYNGDPSKLTNIPAEVRDRVLAYADKVSEYDTALQINGYIDQIRKTGGDVTQGSVFSALKKTYSDAGVKLDSAQKKTLKTYIDKLLASQ